MVKIDLAINSCFALKRWPMPKQWMNIIHSSLDIGLCEFSLDLLDPFTREPTKTTYLQEITELCDELSLKIYSVYTGLQSYEKNLFLHPDLGMRVNSLDRMEKSIDIAAAIDASTIGSDFGSPDINMFLNIDNLDYFIGFLKDLSFYLNRVCYSAGLDSLIFNPPLLSSNYDINIEIAKNMLQYINETSSIPMYFSINMQSYCIGQKKESSSRKKVDFSWINDLGSSLSVIRLQQTDGKDGKFQVFTEEKNKGGLIDIDSLIKILEDSEIKECKFILEVLPSSTNISENIIQDLKSTVKYVKDRI